MKVYHVVDPDTVSAVLDRGITRIARGEKRDEKYIMRTDALLDTHRPQSLIKAGVSRNTNIYAYVRIGDDIISIVDGEAISFADFVRNNDAIVLELTVDPNQCFVSDLDTYDSLKQSLENHKKNLDPLCASYWHKVKKLSEFSSDTIQRPEVMITYDISPKDIKRLN